MASYQVKEKFNILEHRAVQDGNGKPVLMSGMLLLENSKSKCIQYKIIEQSFDLNHNRIFFL